MLPVSGGTDFPPDDRRHAVRNPQQAGRLFQILNETTDDPVRNHHLPG
jgi:hypothetical protein